MGYDVYCLSADAPSAQAKWQTKVCLLRSSFFTSYVYRFTFQKELPYHLLSDRNRVLIGALGAGEGGRTKRSHFVFDKGGMLVDKKMPVKPNDRSVSKNVPLPPFLLTCALRFLARGWLWSLSRPRF